MQTSSYKCSIFIGEPSRGKSFSQAPKDRIGNLSSLNSLARCGSWVKLPFPSLLLPSLERWDCTNQSQSSSIPVTTTSSALPITPRPRRGVCLNRLYNNQFISCFLRKLSTGVFPNPEGGLLRSLEVRLWCEPARTGLTVLLSEVVSEHVTRNRVVLR